MRTAGWLFWGPCILVFFVAAMSAVHWSARLFRRCLPVVLPVGLSVFAVTVVAYTTVGGFRAVALTDAIQGVIMLVGVLIALSAL